MLRFRLYLTCFLVGFTAYTNAFPAANPSDDQPVCRNIINDMLASIENIKTMKYTFKAWERFEEGDIFTELDVKLNVDPFKVYADTKSEINNGVEILYVEGQHDGKAYVNPNKWLIPNVKLSPYGKQMRKGQHNTILNSGFQTLYDIVKAAIKRADTEFPGEFEKYCVYKGDVTWDGRSCYKIEINDPEYRYLDYVVKEGEDVTSIANKHYVSGYLVVEKNENVDWLDDVEPGMKIKIPSSYAKQSILYIDKSTNLPVVQIMYDEKGQFERYEFHDLKVNPTIKDIEFTPDFEGYRF